MLQAKLLSSPPRALDLFRALYAQTTDTTQSRKSAVWIYSGMGLVRRLCSEIYTAREQLLGWGGATDYRGLAGSWGPSGDGGPRQGLRGRKGALGDLFLWGWPFTLCPISYPRHLGYRASL